MTRYTILKLMQQSTTLTRCRPFSEAPGLLFACNLWQSLDLQSVLAVMESQPLSKSSQNPEGKWGCECAQLNNLTTVHLKLVAKSQPENENGTVSQVGCMVQAWNCTPHAMPSGMQRLWALLLPPHHSH